jgi:hypothetical protein
LTPLVATAATAMSKRVLFILISGYSLFYSYLYRIVIL